MFNKKTEHPKGSKKLIGAWTLYDWANSVYSLVISSAIFPIYYSQYIFSNSNSVLMFGVVFHLLMGMYLDRKNKLARPVRYAMESASQNSSWISRNMIITGIMIMLFLALHFYDFWIPEIRVK